MKKYITFVESIVSKGGRVRQHTVFDYLPLDVIKKVNKLESDYVSRASALWFVLTGTKIPKCKTCNGKLFFRMWPRLHADGKYHLREHCCEKCAGLNPKTHEKRIKTNLKKYGHRMPQGNDTVKKKFMSTMMERHGVSWGGQSPEMREKGVQTAIRRHGEDWRQKTYEKIKSTTLRRYGVEHVSQLREVFEKSQAEYHMKDVTIGGKAFRVRGYEPQAIEILHRNGIPVKDILTTSSEGVPSIRWKDGTTNRVYHPDFRVKMNGRWIIIEVKCTYTCGLDGNRWLWQVNKKKFKATERAGYKIKLMVVVKNRAKLIDNPHLHTVYSLRKLLDLPRLPRQ